LHQDAAETLVRYQLRYLGGQLGRIAGEIFQVMHRGLFPSRNSGIIPVTPAEIK
jgi:hypothetical protein